MELTFFSVAGAGLCFGCGVRAMLMAHGWGWLVLGDVHTESRTSQVLRPCQGEGWGVTGNWEGTQPGQLTQTSQRDIPYHGTSCWVYKLGERRKEGRDIRHYGIWQSPDLLGMAGHLPTHGKWEINSLLCFAWGMQLELYPFPSPFHFVIIISGRMDFPCSACCSHLFMLFNLLSCSYLNPWVLYSFPILLPIPLGDGGWATGCVGLGCQPGLNHDSYLHQDLPFLRLHSNFLPVSEQVATGNGCNICWAV